MKMCNPFAYPESMSWLPFLTYSSPGTMLWATLKSSEDGGEAFYFMLREESQIIKAIPKLPSGGVPVEWRLGVISYAVSSGKRVPVIVVLVKTAGGISEVTINALHLDDETMALLDEPFMMLFVGDSGSVERTLIFPSSDVVKEVLKLGRTAYDRYPWTDPDFDEAKEMFEQSTDLGSLWTQMGSR